MRRCRSVVRRKHTSQSSDRAFAEYCVWKTCGNKVSSSIPLPRRYRIREIWPHNNNRYHGRQSHARYRPMSLTDPC